MSALSKELKDLSKGAKDKKSVINTVQKIYEESIKGLDFELKAVATVGVDTYTKYIDGINTLIEAQQFENLFIPYLTSLGLNGTMIVDAHPFIVNRITCKVIISWSN